MSGPRAWRANKASRKKLNLKASMDKLMTSPGKTFKETRQIDNILTRKSQAKIRLATVNVGSLVGRSVEVVETLGRRKVNIVALQEVRYKNDKARTLKGGNYAYKLFLERRNNRTWRCWFDGQTRAGGICDGS